MNLFEKIIHNLDEEFSPDVVSATLEVLTDLLENVGPIVIENGLEKLTRSLEILILREGKCQFYDDEEDANCETDVKIWDPIADLIPKLAKTLRGNFQPMFNKLFEGLFEYSDPERDIYDN